MTLKECKNCQCENMYIFNSCSDAYNNVSIRENHSKKKRRNRLERHLRHQKRLKDLSKYCYEFYYVDKTYVRGKGFIDNPKPYYKRFYWGENRKRFYKKQSNKAVRRYKGEISKGNGYRKLYEYKWIID